MSTDPSSLCDDKLQPITTNSQVLVSSFTLTGVSGTFSSPLTAPKDWYYASLLLLCDYNALVFASGNIAVTDSSGSLLPGVYTGVISSYAFLTVFSGLTLIWLACLVQRNNKVSLSLRVSTTKPTASTRWHRKPARART